MTMELTAADQQAIAAIIAAMEQAWNDGDGDAFARDMAEDADFVNIRAEHFRGRPAIAAGHAAIFRGIYLGSRNRLTLESARTIAPGVALIHVRAALEVPTGPMAGMNQALFSAVLTHGAAGWCIVAFHNTLAPPTGPRH